MLQVFATQVIISRGYNDAPALQFSQGEKGELVRFHVGKKVYDPRAKDNTRWINLSVKAFGPTCERIKKMQLKEGSYINILGRLDEDVWEDATTHAKRSAMVVILDSVEFCFTGNGNKQNETVAESKKQPAPSAANPQPAELIQNAQANAQNEEMFEGFQPFGGNSFFDET